MMRTLPRGYIAIGLFVLGLGACSTLAPPPEPPEWVPELLTQEEAEEGFYPLYNGRDLDGWRVEGGVADTFAVRDGALVVAGGSEGGRLSTAIEYENFVLRYAYRAGSSGHDSGVLIRAAENGRPAVPVPDRVEGGPADGWNEVEVVCDGDSMRTIVNGQPVAEAPNDALPATGRIALRSQVHSVEIRNIRVKPLPGGPGWQPLFYGRDLSGWTVMGDATWRVLDGGVLQVDGATMTGHSSLRTDAAFGDFELRLSIRPHTRANSGVFLRGSGDDAWPDSYEAQVDNHDGANFTGALYDLAPATELRAMDNCWFQMHVIARGRRIEVRVNGKTVAATTASERHHRKYPRGWIALQGHDRRSVVDFRDIEIRRLE